MSIWHTPKFTALLNGMAQWGTVLTHTFGLMHWLFAWLVNLVKKLLSLRWNCSKPKSCINSRHLLKVFQLFCMTYSVWLNHPQPIHYSASPSLIRWYIQCVLTTINPHTFSLPYWLVLQWHFLGKLATYNCPTTSIGSYCPGNHWGIFQSICLEHLFFLITCYAMIISCALV